MNIEFVKGDVVQHEKGAIRIGIGRDKFLLIKKAENLMPGFVPPVILHGDDMAIMYKKITHVDVDQLFHVLAETIIKYIEEDGLK